jgi:hypothetical protein
LAEIKPKLLTKSFTTTPRKISSAVLKLCQEINPDAEPVFVPERPHKDAAPLQCFYNIEELIKREGGSIVYGWAIWEWHRVFIEAEHHAVWEKDGEWIDITPKEHRARKILFLPDPEATYDFTGNQRRINKKRSLGRFASVDKFIEVTDEFQSWVERHSVGLEVHVAPNEYEAHQVAMQEAMITVILDAAYETKPRDRCICASGKEFRKCCSKLIRFQT